MDPPFWWTSLYSHWAGSSLDMVDKSPPPFWWTCLGLHPPHLWCPISCGQPIGGQTLGSSGLQSTELYKRVHENMVTRYKTHCGNDHKSKVRSKTASVAIVPYLEKTKIHHTTTYNSNKYYGKSESTIVVPPWILSYRTRLLVAIIPAPTSPCKLAS